jgi:hypothetical protein
MQRHDHIDPNAVEAPPVTDRAAEAVDGGHQAFSAEHYAGPFTGGAKAMPRNSGEEVLVVPRATFDRAAVVATGIMQIFATAQRPELRQALEDYLLEEFAEVQRQAIADGGLVDA